MIICLTAGIAGGKVIIEIGLISVAQGMGIVDFYDSSIIYDFEKDIVSFCDIDLFRKAPTYNDIGEKYFGTSRLKAPEENILGSIIDEKTNLFTLAAIIFDIFSDVNNILEKRKKEEEKRKKNENKNKPQPQAQSATPANAAPTPDEGKGDE